MKYLTGGKQKEVHSSGNWLLQAKRIFIVIALGLGVLFVNKHLVYPVSSFLYDITEENLSYSLIKRTHGEMVADIRGCGKSWHWLTQPVKGFFEGIM